MRLGGLALLLAALLAPSAAAQAPQPQLHLNVTFPAAPLMPLVEAPAFPTKADVTLRLPVNLTYVVPRLVPTAAETVIRLDIPEAPIWLGASPVPAEIRIETAPGPSTADRVFHRSAELVVFARATAPASTPAALAVSASATQNGAVPPVQANAKGVVTARAYVLFHATAPNVSVEVEPLGEAEVLVGVANRGNDLVIARLVLAHADPGLEASAAPMPVALRPNPLGYQLDRETRHLPVTVRHAGGDGGEILLLATSAVDDPGRLVQERVLRLHVAVLREGPQPSGAWAFLAVAVVVAGIAAARLR